LTCYKPEGAELLYVLATRWLDKHACGDGRGNVWGCCGYAEGGRWEAGAHGWLMESIVV